MTQTPSPSSRPKVGVAAIILSPSSSPTTPPSILTSTRLSSHGAGTLQLPGGHLEHGESFSDTAVREVREETGLEVGKTMEPTKSSPWAWTPWSTMWEWAGAQAAAEDSGQLLPDGRQKLFLSLVNLWRERKELADGSVILGTKRG
ncbi:Nudix hydrolase 1 [Pyrenophora teres f. teres]|uniref:Nudix hydrolase 1 n=1 Tax=Pyrenophora teres f. teres TaxID=97479 RepID=A0A6S6W2J2_9PLEO|nr:Nudix hydrolase 1 [Pyrenophora teres f. teres]